MNLTDARIMARELMDKYNLTHVPFEFDRAKRRMGVCKFIGDKPVLISLSEFMVRLNSEKVVRETILHEISHAKAGRAAGHGPRWKAWAIAMGVSPSSMCGDGDAIAPPQRYSAVCPACKKTLYKTKRPTRAYWCLCTGKNFRSQDKLVWRDSQGGWSESWTPETFVSNSFSRAPILAAGALVTMNRGPLKGTQGRVVEVGKLIRVQMPSGIMAVPQSMLDIAE